MAHRALLCFAIIGLLVVSPGAGAKGPEPLAQTIATLVRRAGLGDGLGIHVVRLHDAQELYRNRPERPRNPASNQKLLTAAAALRRLGPAFRAATKVEGTIKNGRVTQLVVRASGDPSLGYAGLDALAEALHLRGVDSVDRILIDDTYFDDQILPPAFEQQPKESAAFRAAISAFAVNRNSYVVHLGPGAELEGPGRVRVLADGYVQIDNRTVTIAGGPPTPRIEDKLTEDGHLAVRVDGAIPKQVRTLYYRRRVPDPKTYAALLLVRALKKAGLGGALAVEYGPVTEQQPVLVDMPSSQLSSLLYPVGKWSDNFTAEMLLKILGAQLERPGTSANGTVVVREELMKMGVDTEGLVMVNGSGLFDGLSRYHHLIQTFHRAWTGHNDDLFTTDNMTIDCNFCIVRLKVSAGQLEGTHDGHHPIDAIHSIQRTAIQLALIANKADYGHLFPSGQMCFKSLFLDAGHNRLNIRFTCTHFHNDNHFLSFQYYQIF